MNILKRGLFLFVVLVSLFLPATAYAQVHARPVSTATLSPSPTNQGTNLSTYSDPVTVTIDAPLKTDYTKQEGYPNNANL